MRTFRDNRKRGNYQPILLLSFFEGTDENDNLRLDQLVGKDLAAKIRSPRATVPNNKKPANHFTVAEVRQLSVVGSPSDYDDIRIYLVLKKSKQRRRGKVTEVVSVFSIPAHRHVKLKNQKPIILRHSSFPSIHLLVVFVVARLHKNSNALCAALDGYLSWCCECGTLLVEVRGRHFVDPHPHGYAGTHM